MKLSVLCVAAAIVGTLEAQQLVDTQFDTSVATPLYRRDEGPLITIDAGHGNFHTADGRYRPFADVLRNDGFRITTNRERFRVGSFGDVDILVIANPRVQPPATGSAFSKEEIQAVEDWVRSGGALFLIADHMPAAGAASELAAAFGAVWPNGFAMDTSGQGTLVFSRVNGWLADHSVTRGRNAAERVDQVVAFTGSAFRIDATAEPLMTFGTGIEVVEPKVPWEFSSDTKRTDATGWHQGAVLRHGNGKVALFGEAAMFTAQRAGPGQGAMGMNAPRAISNKQFLLNVVRWLAGVLR